MVSFNDHGCWTVEHGAALPEAVRLSLSPDGEMGVYCQCGRSLPSVIDAGSHTIKIVATCPCWAEVDGTNGR